MSLTASVDSQEAYKQSSGRLNAQFKVPETIVIFKKAQSHAYTSDLHLWVRLPKSRHVSSNATCDKSIKVVAVALNSYDPTLHLKKYCAAVTLLITFIDNCIITKHKQLQRRTSNKVVYSANYQMQLVHAFMSQLRNCVQTWLLHKMRVGSCQIE